MSEPASERKNALDLDRAKLASVVEAAETTENEFDGDAEIEDYLKDSQILHLSLQQTFDVKKSLDDLIDNISTLFITDYSLIIRLKIDEENANNIYEYFITFLKEAQTTKSINFSQLKFLKFYFEKMCPSDSRTLYLVKQFILKCGKDFNQPLEASQRTIDSEPWLKDTYLLEDHLVGFRIHLQMNISNSKSKLSNLTSTEDEPERKIHLYMIKTLSSLQDLIVPMFKTLQSIIDSKKINSEELIKFERQADLIRNFLSHKKTTTADLLYNLSDSLKSATKSKNELLHQYTSQQQLQQTDVDAGAAGSVSAGKVPRPETKKN